MKIQLSPKKIIPGVMTVWNRPGPEVDVVMELNKLTFKEKSIEVIFAFHVLDHLFPEEIPGTLENWKKLLTPTGDLFVVVDDFEYICRGFVGGDIPIDKLNDEFNHPTQFSRDNLTKQLSLAGFRSDIMKIWFADVPGLFAKKHFELVVQATNYEQTS